METNDDDSEKSPTCSPIGSVSAYDDNLPILPILPADIFDFVTDIPVEELDSLISGRSGHNRVNQEKTCDTSPTCSLRSESPIAPPLADDDDYDDDDDDSDYVPTDEYDFVPDSDSNSNSNSDSDFLIPSMFDQFADAALKACAKDVDDMDELKHPSVAIKLGFDISRLASLKLAHCIKISNQKGRSDAQDFLQLMKIQWSVKVTKLASIVLYQHRFNSKKSLPHPNDIACLAKFLTRQILSLDLTDLSSTNFRRAATLCLAKLETYNKRRCGEMESLL